MNSNVGAPHGPMSFDRPTIRARARELLKGKWNYCALVMLVYTVITGGFSSLPRVGWLLSLAVSGPMTLGLSAFFLNLTRGRDARIEQVFDGFKEFVRGFLAYLLIMIFVILWALLLIVPGIIAALSYALTYYLMVDNPELSAMDAMGKSKELMRGHKMDLFLLGLSFLGWALLCILTLGIGFLWLAPYMNASFALFYQGVVAGAGNRVGPA